MAIFRAEAVKWYLHLDPDSLLTGWLAGCAVCGVNEWPILFCRAQLFLFSISEAGTHLSAATNRFGWFIPRTSQVTQQEGQLIKTFFRHLHTRWTHWTSGPTVNPSGGLDMVKYCWWWDDNDVLREDYRDLADTLNQYMICYPHIALKSA